MATYTEDFAGGAASLTTPWVQWRNPVDGKDLQRDGSGQGRAQINSGDCGAIYNNTTGNDQYAQAQPIWSPVSTDYFYLIVRSDLTGPDIHNNGSFYIVWTNGVNSTLLRRINAGAATSLDTANGTTFVSGDTFKLEVIGSTLKVYKNGAAITWTTSGTTSVVDGSPIPSGFAGTGLFTASASTNKIDNWEGGDVVLGDIAAFVGEPITGSSAISL